MSAIPSGLNLYNPPRMADIRRFPGKFQPINGTSFNPSSTLKINIPAEDGIYLNPHETYLKFTFNNQTVDNVAADKAVNLDSTGWCLIQKWELFHGSNTLETYDHVNAFLHFWMDYTMGASERQHGHGTMMGHLADPDDLQERRGQSVAGGSALTLVLPCIGLLGSGSVKALPLSAMVEGGDLRLEITLASANEALVTAVGTDVADYNISNIELVTDLMRVPQDLDDTIKGGPDNNLELMYHSWQNYRSNISTTDTSTSLLIPARFNAVKQIFSLIRRSDNLTTNTAFSTSSRSFENMTQYQFRVGSELYPSKAINTRAENNVASAEGLAEVLKAVGQVGNMSMGGVVTRGTFSAVAPANAEGTFAVAIDFEVYDHQNLDTAFTGINTTQINIFEELQFNAITQASTIDHYVLYDAKLVIQGGVASIIF